MPRHDHTALQLVKRLRHLLDHGDGAACRCGAARIESLFTQQGHDGLQLEITNLELPGSDLGLKQLGQPGLGCRCQGGACRGRGLQAELLKG